MELGIFSKTYEGTLEDVFFKMSKDNLHHTQFNMACIPGYESIPSAFNTQDLNEVVLLSKKYNIKIDALSGTFNMIDSNKKDLEENIIKFKNLCLIANALEIPIITLCTGSRNRESKWKWSDDNLSDKSWDTLIDTTSKILGYAKEYDVILGVETEASNIINTPERARKYLDVFKSDHLKIVMDGANLFVMEQVCDMKKTLNEAFKYLGNDICLAHAKDLAPRNGISFVAAGEGILDYKEYIKLLNESNYNGPLIMHGLSSEQVKKSSDFLRGIINDL